MPGLRKETLFANPLTLINSTAKRFRLWRKWRKFRKWSKEDRRRNAFYRQFINPGELVFDVGANVGNRAKIFHELGAVVVAVEPQRQCADILQDIFRGKSNFHLVRSALGASQGEAEMSICPANTISSLADDWIAAVKESGRFGSLQWDTKERVVVDTLDNLIERYGRPAFVKIDVEGFEDRVLAGLSTPVSGLSLEFTPEILASTFTCIERLCSLGEPRFQLSLGESMELAAPDWVDADEIKRWLLKVPPTAFGDLYVRFNLTGEWRKQSSVAA